MKLIILLFVASTCASITNVCFDCHKINNRCYKPTNILDLPADIRKGTEIQKIGILRSKNTLYYSFESSVDDLEHHKTGYINLDNPSNNDILFRDNLKLNLSTFDIDQENEIVYLGGDNRIYYSDEINDFGITFYSSLDEDIVTIFFKDYVYFVKNSERKIKKKVGDAFYDHIESVYVGAVKHFVINKDYETVFVNTVGMFLTNGDEIVKLTDDPHFRGLALDLDSTIYAWRKDEIYNIMISKDLYDSKLVKVGNISPNVKKIDGDDSLQIGAITFDKDNNMLYTRNTALIKLNVMDEDIVCGFFKFT